MASSSGEAKKESEFLEQSEVPTSAQCNGGENKSRKDFDDCLYADADAVIDGFQSCPGNSVISELDRRSMSDACSASSCSEGHASMSAAILSGCFLHGRPDASDIENSDDGTGSLCSESTDVGHTYLQSGYSDFDNDEYFPFRSSAPDLQRGSNGTHDAHVMPELRDGKPAKRAFCKRCQKAQDLCICSRFKSVVQNSIKITILQNPKEKQHAVGSVRVALLGLENIALVNVPEIHIKESFRVRPKVPGSKRCMAGRGGKKGGKTSVFSHDKAPSEIGVSQARNVLVEIFKCHLHDDMGWGVSKLMLQHCDGDHGIGGCDMVQLKGELCANSGKVGCNAQAHEASSDALEGSPGIHGLELLVPPGVALLFPSDKAIELSELSMSREEQHLNVPTHLLVLDGTWSKARRIYFENPWLQKLPHFKLSPPSPSLYEGVRKQPKPGCLSTLESIVYALKILEPDKAEGLDGLLEVFESMVADQRRCKELKVGSWSGKGMSGNMDSKYLDLHLRK